MVTLFRDIVFRESIISCRKLDVDIRIVAILRFMEIRVVVIFQMHLGNPERGTFLVESPALWRQNGEAGFIRRQALFPTIQIKTTKSY